VVAHRRYAECLASESMVGGKGINVAIDDLQNIVNMTACRTAALMFMLLILFMVHLAGM